MSEQSEPLQQVTPEFNIMPILIRLLPVLTMAHLDKTYDVNSNNEDEYTEKQREDSAKSVYVMLTSVDPQDLFNFAMEADFLEDYMKPIIYMEVGIFIIFEADTQQIVGFLRCEL